MCQSIIAVIAGKYLEQLVYENCTLEVSIIQRHANKSGKKIIIESTKDSDATIEVLPLCSHKCGKSKLWDFIAEFLPDYLLATKLQILSENEAKLDRNTHYLIHDPGQDGRCCQRSVLYIPLQKQMNSKQYPYEVNVLRKRVNHLRESRQLSPGARVNLFSMDRQMLKNKA